MSSLLKGLESKIEKAVQGRMTPILLEMQRMRKELEIVNKNLEKIYKLLDRK